MSLFLFRFVYLDNLAKNLNFVLSYRPNITYIGNGNVKPISLPFLLAEVSMSVDKIALLYPASTILACN